MHHFFYGWKKVICYKPVLRLLSIINTELLSHEKTVASASFPEGIDTHGPFIIFVSWLDEEIVAIDERDQSVVSYASTGINQEILGILFL